MYGVERLPEAWCAELDVGDIVDRVATDLYAMGHDNREFDYLAYPPDRARDHP
jgi:hypothetical protein